MRKLILAGVAGLALAAAAPVLASTVSGPIFPSAKVMNKDCQGLENEFDQMSAHAGKRANLPGAEMLRKDGARLCKAGQYPGGIMTLHSALETLGVAPLNTSDPLQDGVV